MFEINTVETYAGLFGGINLAHSITVRTIFVWCILGRFFIYIIRYLSHC